MILEAQIMVNIHLQLQAHNHPKLKSVGCLVAPEGRLWPIAVICVALCNRDVS